MVGSHSMGLPQQHRDGLGRASWAGGPRRCRLAQALPEDTEMVHPRGLPHGNTGTAASHHLPTSSQAAARFGASLMATLVRVQRKAGCMLSRHRPLCGRGRRLPLRYRRHSRRSRTLVWPHSTARLQVLTLLCPHGR